MKIFLLIVFWYISSVTVTVTINGEDKSHSIKTLLLKLPILILLGYYILQ